MAGQKRKIVVAWVVEDVEVVKAGRPDIGKPPTLRQVLVPKAVMWKNSGDESDVEKALRYAAQQTDRKAVVIEYPTSERDPLGRAKKDVLEHAKKEGR